jgi:toxin HigB-1
MAGPLDACCATRYNRQVIKSFKHKGLAKLYKTGSARGVQPQHAQRLRMQLAALDSALTVDDLEIPGYRLHQLKGNRRGIWSITVSANWRVTFKFVDGNAYIIDYEDYH